jgi:hypothetical protein
MRATLHNLDGRFKTNCGDPTVNKGKNIMSKLNRFFASCLLIMSLSAVAFAGETQGPNVYWDATTTAVSEDLDATESSSTISDALKTAESVTVWLLTEVF